MKGCDVMDGPIQKLITAVKLLAKNLDAKFDDTISVLIVYLSNPFRSNLLKLDKNWF